MRPSFMRAWFPTFAITGWALVGSAAVGACSLRGSLDGWVAECTTAADCPAPPGGCFVASCELGTCGSALDATHELDDPEGNCIKLVCGVGGVPVTIPNPSDAVDSGTASCREAVCDGATQTLATKAVGTICDAGFCNVAGECVECLEEAHCANEEQCDSFTCVPLHCVNDTLDVGIETDEDCGAECAPCTDGLVCVSGEDCQSGVCSAELVCVAPSCDDGIVNQDETDQDCGGAICGACLAGQACYLARDCESLVCTVDADGGVCQEASCDDGVQNAEETDIDCGKYCGTQQLCGPGQYCASDGDCIGQSCADEGKCAETCFDQIQNNGEAGVDCGGDCQLACAIGEEPVND